MSYDPEKIRKRIIKNSEKNETGCWAWKKSLTKSGYPDMCVYKEQDHGGHRWSYRVFKGEIPNKKLVCHSCDNRNCVNPNHLFLGTPRDNIIDMHKKGRWCNRKGTNHPLSKLKQTDINKMFYLKEAGKNQSEIAKKFNVDQSCVSRVLNNKTGWTGGSR